MTREELKQAAIDAAVGVVVLGLGVVAVAQVVVWIAQLLGKA